MSSFYLRQYKTPYPTRNLQEIGDCLLPTLSYRNHEYNSFGTHMRTSVVARGFIVAVLGKRKVSVNTREAVGVTRNTKIDCLWIGADTAWGQLRYRATPANWRATMAKAVAEIGQLGQMISFDREIRQHIQRRVDEAFSIETNSNTQLQARECIRRVGEAMMAGASATEVRARTKKAMLAHAAAMNAMGCAVAKQFSK